MVWFVAGLVGVVVGVVLTLLGQYGLVQLVLLMSPPAPTPPPFPHHDPKYPPVRVRYSAALLLAVRAQC